MYGLILCLSMISPFNQMYLFIFWTVRWCLNLYRLFHPSAQCHTAAVPSSQALSPCPWWKQNQCPTRLQRGHQTTTGGLCKVTSGTWSACTFLDQEGMPVTPRQHRGATPVSSSTTSPELSHSHTSRRGSGNHVGGGWPMWEDQKCSWCTASLTRDEVRCGGIQSGKAKRHEMWRAPPPPMHSIVTVPDLPAIIDRHTSDNKFFLDNLKSNFSTSLMPHQFRHTPTTTYKAEETPPCPSPSSRLLPWRTAVKTGAMSVYFVHIRKCFVVFLYF